MKNLVAQLFNWTISLPPWLAGQRLLTRTPIKFIDATRVIFVHRGSVEAIIHRARLAAQLALKAMEDAEPWILAFNQRPYNLQSRSLEVLFYAHLWVKLRDGFDLADITERMLRIDSRAANTFSEIASLCLALEAVGLKPKQVQVVSHPNARLTSELAFQYYSSQFDFYYWVTTERPMRHSNSAVFDYNGFDKNYAGVKPWIARLVRDFCKPNVSLFKDQTLTCMLQLGIPQTQTDQLLSQVDFKNWEQ